MAEIKTFDCVTTDLLCNEQSKVLCFDDDGHFTIEPFDDQSSSCHQINGGKGNGVSESEPLIPLPCLSDESIGWMVDRERHHLPRQDYLIRLRSGDLDLSLRCEALDWMIKACSYHKFSELCLYSAMNFFDRFLSVYNVPEGRTWANHLAAVSCLSISSKVNEVNVPCLVDLQAGNPRFLFEAKTIQRMEILVLNCLDWNMNVLTPFSFLDYFLGKLVTNWSQVPQGALIARSIGIILRTIEGIDFLEFRPSEIAAAAVVYVSDEMQAVDIDKAFFGCIGVEKGRVAKCLEMVRELVSGTIAATTTITAITSESMDTLSKPYGSNGLVDACASCAATTAVTAANVSNGAVSLMVPYSSNGVLDAYASSADTTITATASVGIGMILPMPPNPNGVLNASASTTAIMTTSVGSAITSSVPPSPNGVLDAVFFRVESCPSSSHTSPDTKRRKLDHMTALKGGS